MSDDKEKSLIEDDYTKPPAGIPAPEEYVECSIDIALFQGCNRDVYDQAVELLTGDSILLQKLIKNPTEANAKAVSEHVKKSLLSLYTDRIVHDENYEV